MAKQVGPIYITGTIGGVSFYKSGNEYLVRMKGGPTRQQVTNGKNFVRVRENYNEFGNCSKAGKRLRQAVKRWCRVGDKGLYRRLTQLLTKIKNEDRQAARGQRRVSEGLRNEYGKALLRQFDFNKAARLGDVLLKPLRLTNFGAIEIKALNPGTDIKFAKGATTLRLKAACVQVDLESGKTQIHAYDELLLKKDHASRDILLKPKDVNTLLKSNEGELFYFVWIAFDDNSKGANDVLCLVDVNKQLCTDELVKKKRLKKPFRVYRNAAARGRIFVREAPFVLRKKEAPA